MIKNNLESTYYHLKDGQPDVIASILKSECFKVSSYFIIKNPFKNYFNPYILFLDNITFSLSKYKNNKIAYADVISNHINESLIKVNIHSNNELNALLTLEKLLDKYGMVILQTVNHKLPFSVYYQENYNINNFIPGHSFLVIGHDKDFIYYVDEKSCINYSNFTSYKYNRDIGVVKKQDILPAINCFFRAYTITFDKSDMNDAEANINKIFKEIINDYHKLPSVSGEIITLYGKEAILNMIDICYSENTFLDKKVESPMYNNTLHKLLYWKFTVAADRRRMLYYLILNYYKYKNESDLVDLISQSVNKWLLFRNILEKRYLKNYYLIDSNLIKYLMDILKVEEKIIYLLDKLLRA